MYIKVRFQHSTAAYTYKCELAVKVGDIVVVRARGILSLAKVVELNAQPELAIKYLHVIDVVDMSGDIDD